MRPGWITRRRWKRKPGTIQFQNYARFSREEEGWRLQWNDGLIFPDLTASDTVRVEETAGFPGEHL